MPYILIKYANAIGIFEVQTACNYVIISEGAGHSGLFVKEYE